MTQFINAIIYSLFYELVGEDLFKNKYYVKNIANIEKRVVVYKNEMDPSKLPADWYYWLHYLTNKKPNMLEK